MDHYGLASSTCIGGKNMMILIPGSETWFFISPYQKSRVQTEKSLKIKQHHMATNAHPVIAWYRTKQVKLGSRRLDPGYVQVLSGLILTKYWKEIKILPPKKSYKQQAFQKGKNGKIYYNSWKDSTMVNLEIFTSLEGKVHSFLNTKFSYLDHCTWTTKMSSKNVTTHPLLLTMEKKLVKRHY